MMDDTTLCTTADPAAALAREAAISYQIKVMGSILGIVAAFWLAASIFFLYHFHTPMPKDPKILPTPTTPRPLPLTPRQEEEGGIELHDLSRGEHDPPEWWSKY
jgi:hypothetical protein